MPPRGMREAARSAAPAHARLPSGEDRKQHISAADSLCRRSSRPVAEEHAHSCTKKRDQFEEWHSVGRLQLTVKDSSNVSSPTRRKSSQKMAASASSSSALSCASPSAMVVAAGDLIC
eukprot:578203-Rhodomonas_salina.1